MVSGQMIAAKVNYGLGKLGGAAGAQLSWFRPQNSGPVLAGGNMLGAIDAYIATGQSLAAQPSDWGKPDRFAAFDPTGFLAGDYLADAGGVYFVGELIPICGMIRLAVCNESFIWSRMVAGEPGPGYQRGAVTATPLATEWPGWLETADRRSAPELHLPGTVELPNAQILLPVSLPGQISRGDRLTCGEPPAISWTVQGAVMSPNGWQITAVQAGA